MTETDPRRPVHGPILLVLALVGLGTSALMLYLYLAPAAGSCGPGGGCDAVRSSRYSEIMGIPLPYLGLAYFGGLAAALMVPALRKRWLLTALGIGGVATGLTLLTLQGAVLGAWCPYCVVVDVCSLGAGLAVLPGLDGPGLRWSRGPVLTAFGLGVAVPVALFTALHTPPEPPVIGGPAPVLADAAPVDGKATIIEFVDFECPFCRRQHQRLETILADYGERVRVVYKHMPLDMHPHAKEAARFACCAEEQGQGHAMADALFSHETLTYEGCFQCALQVGLDEALLRDCLASDRPDARLDADSAEAGKVSVRALPTCFIGNQRFEGLQSEATLRAAIDAALEDGGASS